MSRKSKHVSKKRSATKKPAVPFDKYTYYLKAVQSPDSDVEFMWDAYEELRGRSPISMREDFCGTFATCCEWVKKDKKLSAIGLDFDSEPLAWGHKHHMVDLTAEQKSRMCILEKDVLASDVPSADIICALNFSYFGFKERQTLVQYFRKVHESLNADGIFVMDCFGGSRCYEANVEETEFEDEGFSYFWDQDSFNPINHHAMFYIHFKRDGEKKQEEVFTYDWRLWSIPEIRDMLAEAGFRTSHIYWEGTDEEDGSGDGEFSRTEEGEDCESWIAYIVAEK